MKRLLAIAVLALLVSPSLVHAQVQQFPNGVNITGGGLTAATATVSIGGPMTIGGTLTASGGMVNGCNWTMTTYGGVAAQTANVACLANFSHVTYAGAANGGTPTAVITPGQAATTPLVNVNCAITATGSTTVACLAPAGQSTMIIYGTAW